MELHQKFVNSPLMIIDTLLSVKRLPLNVADLIVCAVATG